MTPPKRINSIYVLAIVNEIPISHFFLPLVSDEYDKHPNEVVKNEELTYNNNGGFSLMRTNRRHADDSTTFLFSWMPPQLSFIVLTLSLVFFLNYLFVIQSIFAPNIRRVIRCKVPAGATTQSDDRDSETRPSSKQSSKMCQLASSQCQLTNVPRTDVGNDDHMTACTWSSGTNITTTTATTPASTKSSLESQLAHVSTLIECSLRTTTATASVKLIDKAMPPQLIPLQRRIVTTNFNNDNTTLSPNNILNNTNTILNYSKTTFVHSHLNRTYDDDSDSDDDEQHKQHANGTINLTNKQNDAFIALYTTNSDNIKLNISSVKFSLDNDSCIRHNSIECSSGGNMQQHQQHKQHCDYSNCRTCSGATLVRCYR